MINSVIDPDGNSYEKHAIEDWICCCTTSPITRRPLSIDDLRPNLALKTAIDEHRQSIQPNDHSHTPLKKSHSSDITVSGSYANGFFHSSIQPPQEEIRSSCDICCVVDTSGSMSTRAEIQNDKNEQYGLSQLDLVKHALKTIIHSLQGEDRLSTVSFSGKATIIFPLTKMDDEGKINALAEIERLSADFDLINRHKFRLEFVNFVRTALEQMYSMKTKPTTTKEQHKSAMNLIQTLQTNMRKYADGKDEFLKDLFADLTGQVQQAIEKEDWFNKWGVHFLPNLTRAHLLQFCNHFKDPGVQHYGKGTFFTQVRDEMDEIFCSLPAPKRSQTGAQIDMTVFHNATGECFYGECTVRLMDGTTKLLENNLIITAWHPIRLATQLIMPCSLVSSTNEISCEAVYNFVLNQGHTVFVNDIECVTLGHGFQEDVVRHSYYGRQRVIKDLQRLNMKQNNAGFIEITEETLVRKNKTGLVIGLQSQQILV
ncbi:unnamed protein product [Rotaria sordida]|uniref:U-box domain-containing protein n=1 Tax=Rotaria sordida TaxID=392033 RepID=A0A814ESQ7_9BILA|nr:unnamed protein product [Rotaria sordida]